MKTIINEVLSEKLDADKQKFTNWRIELQQNSQSIAQIKRD